MFPTLYPPNRLELPVVFPHELDRLVDAMHRAEAINRLATTTERVVVIDVDDTSGYKAIVQASYRVPGRYKEIAVEA